MNQHFLIKFFTFGIITLCLYALGLYYLLPQQLTQIYGFITPVSLPQMLEQFILITPMIAALCSLLLCKYKDQMVLTFYNNTMSKYWFTDNFCGEALSIFFVNMIFALVFLVTSFFLLALKTSNFEVLFSQEAVYFWWVSLLDLTLVGVFIYFLHALSRITWVTVLIFISYSFAVVWLGSHFGIIKYIGFGTTPNVINTQFSEVPLNNDNAMAFRFYWLSLVMVLLALLSAVSKVLPHNVLRPINSNNKRFIPITLFAPFFLLVGSQLIWSSSSNLLVHVEDPVKFADISLQSRPKLSNIDLELNLIEPEKLKVTGQMELSLNSSSKIRKVILLKPDLFSLKDLRIIEAPYTNVDEQGRYIILTIPGGMNETSKLTISYVAESQQVTGFKKDQVQQIMDKGSFLFSRNFMPKIISTCEFMKSIKSHFQDCLSKENYLKADRISGFLTINTAKGIELVAPGILHKSSENNYVTQKFELKKQFSEFYIAFGNFNNYTKEVGNSQLSLVTVTQLSDAQQNQFFNILEDIFSYYQKHLEVELPERFRVVQLPRHLGEAFSFGDTVFMSESILSQTNLDAQQNDTLLRFVLAHEVVHNWFGYTYIPANKLGKGFLLESTSQLAAYTYLSHSKLMSLEEAIQQEANLYCRSLSHQLKDLPLAQVTDEPHLTYHKGALVLLFLQHKSDGTFLTQLHRAIAEVGQRQTQIEFSETLLNLQRRMQYDDFSVAQLLLTQKRVLASIQELDTSLTLPSCVQNN